MNIQILTEGGKSVGFGHVVRCLAIYVAFEEMNTSPELIVNSDKSILHFLKSKNYKRFNWLKQQNKLFKITESTEVVVIDSYLAEKYLYEKISETTNGIMVMIDDFNRIDYPKGIIVNPSIYGNKSKYIRKNGMVYLLGKDYIILRKEFWDVPEKKINKETKKILITFGGINHYDLAKKIVNVLKDEFGFNFYIVDSSKNKLTAKEMLNLMLQSDICISGGGQTTYELARVGVPTIGICFAENQLGNLMNLEKVDFLKFAGWFDGKNLFHKIKENVNELDYDSRLKMSKTGKKYVDGQGAKRIVKEILERRGK